MRCGFLSDCQSSSYYVLQLINASLGVSWRCASSFSWWFALTLIESFRILDFQYSMLGADVQSELCSGCAPALLRMHAGSTLSAINNLNIFKRLHHFYMCFCGSDRNTRRLWCCRSWWSWHVMRAAPWDWQPSTPSSTSWRCSTAVSLHFISLYLLRHSDQDYYHPAQIIFLHNS